MATADIDFRAIAGAALSSIAVILDHLGVQYRRAGFEFEMLRGGTFLS